MGDLTGNLKEHSGGRWVRKKRRRRSPGSFRKNLLWIGIILIIALIFGAFVGMSSHVFDRYFSSEEEFSTSPKDMTKKLRNLDIDRLLREREKLKK